MHQKVLYTTNYKKKQDNIYFQCFRHINMTYYHVNLKQYNILIRIIDVLNL